jgi:hypothetical protein
LQKQYKAFAKKIQKAVKLGEKEQPSGAGESLHPKGALYYIHYIQDIQEPVWRRVTKMAYPKVRHFHLGMGD